MVIEIIAGITQQLMNFFIPEILFMIFVEKSGNGFKFRFARIEGTRLKPFANKLTVGVVAFVIYLFSTPIIEFLLGTTIKTGLISLGLLNLLLLTVSLSLFTLMFIVYYLLGKKSDRNTAIFAVITVIFFAIFLTRVFNHV